MPQKVSGKPVCKCKEWPGKFMEYLISQKSGRSAVNFLPPSGASDQYLQNTPALTLQREKPGTRREGIMLNMPIRYAECHE